MKYDLKYMEKIIASCDILLDGSIISRELLLRDYADFASQVLWSEKRNVGIVLHTGSICFDAISIIFAAVCNWMQNTNTPEEIIDSLSIGDPVVYKGKRRIYKGKCSFDGEPYIQLITQRLDHGRSTNDTALVPMKLWSTITPYYGESECMDGRGIRKHNTKCQEFLSKILELPLDQIPSITDVSTVILLPKERADYLVDHLSIKYGLSDPITLPELATVSYFTESDEYPYGGNLGKTEPLLKITSKVSVARRLIVRPEENKISGLLVLGNEFLISGQTELPSLLNRKSLQYVLVASHIDTENIAQIFEEVESPLVFPCTKEFLLDHSLPVINPSPVTLQLDLQVNDIIEHEITPFEISSSQTWSDYKQAKYNLGLLRTADVLGKDKDTFIVGAYSLMKLFMTAVFPIELMEQLVADHLIDTDSPQKRIDELITIAETFPDTYRDRAKSVIDLLEYLYLEVIEHNRKEHKIRELIQSGTYKKIAIVVPKAFYRDIMLQLNWMEEAQSTCDITIVTATRFDNNSLYDCIIVPGIFEGKRFSIFKCKAAPVIIPIIYDFEALLYRHKVIAASRVEHGYNNASFVPVSDSDEIEVTEEDAVEYEAAAAINAEDDHLEEYIRELEEVSLINSLNKCHTDGSGMLSEIVSLARFDNGQVAFFSKAYTPYILDNAKQEVVTIDLKDLSPGDSVLFTQNNNETKDIVDAILLDLIETHRLGEDKCEAYRKSKHWKHALHNFILQTDTTYQAIVEILSILGITKSYTAIRDWVDPDSHTVGPLDEESYIGIARMTEDSEMLKDPKSFCDACSVIRKIRRRILRQIGLAIIGSLSGAHQSDDPLFDVVRDKINDIAQVLTVTSIAAIEDKQLSSAMANRPLSIQEE